MSDSSPHDPTDRAPERPRLSVGERRWVRGYVWTGVLAAMLATMPTSLAEIAVIPPALFFLPTAHKTWRLWSGTLRRPAVLALLAFYAWVALGLLWSPDRALGVDEAGTARFFLVSVLLAPALRTTTTGRRHILLALCLGFLIGHAVQLLNLWALHWGGPESFRFGRLPERVSGWWDPAVAGTILAAAIGLHLPKALMGTGRGRVLAIMGVFATAGGLAMTGSRGGWIAGVLLTMGTGVFALIRAGVRGTGRGGTAFAFIALVCSFLVVGFAFRGPIAERLNAAETQVRDAMGGEVTGDTGARIAMKGEALAAVRAHPVIGVGTGGFRDWMTQRRDEGDRVAESGHAHDTILHVAASNGLVGVALLLAVFGFALRDAWRNASEHGLGTYHAGPMVALVGLALATPFDTLHVSATAASVTGIVFALCLAPPRNDDDEMIDVFADDRKRNALKQQNDRAGFAWFDEKTLGLSRGNAIIWSRTWESVTSVEAWKTEIAMFDTICLGFGSAGTSEVQYITEDTVGYKEFCREVNRRFDDCWSDDVWGGVAFPPDEVNHIMLWPRDKTPDGSSSDQPI